MTEGSSKEDEEVVDGKKGQDLFANVPSYQQSPQEPTWPGQKARAKPAPQINQNPDPKANPNTNQAGQGVQQLSFPEAAPQLQLPTKPKVKNQPNMPQTRPLQPQSQPQPGAAGPNTSNTRIPANYVLTGTNIPAVGPGAQPGGLVPPNPGAPQVNIRAVQNPQAKPGSPVISSASAKPNWTQPQWPTGKANEGQSKTGLGPLLARRASGRVTGNRLPPAIEKVPEAPFAQAPPTSGAVQRNWFGDHQSPIQNQINISLSPNSNNPGLKSQLPFTIQRDLIFAKQVLGEELKRGAANERREYKQKEYIPEAPVLKVSAPDPDRPWSPVPAAQYEFFTQSENGGPNAQNTIHSLGQSEQERRDVQFARGFNPANPINFSEGEGQPDPRYAPFQGELLQDIERQDKRFGHSEEPIAAERRERGAAALRALGRSSDKYYEGQTNTGTQQEHLPKAIRLTSRDLFGLATYYFIVTKEVLTAPQAFFANMSLVGGLNDPLIYLAFTSVMTGLLAALAKLNPLLFILAGLYGFISVALSAVIIQFIFKRLGSEGKFEQTFNVLAYSKATFIFAWFSLGPLPIGAIVATLFTVYLNFLGLSRVHRLPPQTIVIVIVLLNIVPLLSKFWIK